MEYHECIEFYFLLPGKVTGRWVYLLTSFSRFEEYLSRREYPAYLRHPGWCVLEVDEMPKTHLVGVLRCHESALPFFSLAEGVEWGELGRDDKSWVTTFVLFSFDDANFLQVEAVGSEALRRVKEALPLGGSQE